MISRERILVTVKTYPTLSSTYDEIVCTAGFREDASWIRLYPVPFRKYDEYQRYHKFQWIELDIEKNPSDSRVESYRPLSEIKLLDDMGTDNGWQARRDFVLGKGDVYTNLKDIIARNRARELSLATFKPTEIIQVTAEPDSREWDKVKLDAVQQRSRQGHLFEEPKRDFKVVNKLPYKFKYEFLDDAGTISKLMIEDWELGALYWRQFRARGSETEAIDDVKSKYMNDLTKDRDTHLFLGTTKEWDARAPNPFLVIGVFYPPMKIQDELFKLEPSFVLHKPNVGNALRQNQGTVLSRHGPPTGSMR